METKGDAVYSYWESAAEHLVRDGRKATAPDQNLQELIEEALLRFIRPQDRVLDIGCGDGTSSRRLAGHCAEVVGVDYVPGFIELARQSNARANLSFSTANVLDLTDIRQRFGRFDVVTSIRCLINLSAWEDQQRAVGQIASLVKPGGLYLAGEGWSDGLDGLNAKRERCGLERIPVIHHNLFMDRAAFASCASRYFEKEHYETFGLYLFLSRVMQPVFVSPEKPGYDHPLNRTAVVLQKALDGDGDFADCDYAGVFVLRRREG